MKEIKNYNAEKYNSEKYELIEEGIYKTESDMGTVYVTSLSFVQEPKLGEGKDSSDISQYPIEDILEKFNCWVEDLYEDLYTESSKICYHEFCGFEVEDLRALRGIIGKHVYNKEDGEYVDLIIEDEKPDGGFISKIKKFFSK